MTVETEDIVAIAIIMGGGLYAYKALASVPPDNVERTGVTAVATVQAPNSAAYPRGIRNNNPANIKWSSGNNRQGQTGKDSAGFVVFSA